MNVYPPFSVKKTKPPPKLIAISMEDIFGKTVDVHFESNQQQNLPFCYAEFYGIQFKNFTERID